MNKPTPGPWRMDPDNMNVYSSGMVALVHGHIHNGEKLANAQLISAAPSMLEALKDLFKMMDEEILVRNIDQDHKPEWALKTMGVITRLKANYDVIAKAEGKKP